MKKAAEDAGRTHGEDKATMSAMAALSIVGAAYPELSNWFVYIMILPLNAHLVRIAYLGYKFKHRNDNEVKH